MTIQRIPCAAMAMVVDFLLTGTLVVSMWGESFDNRSYSLLMARLSVFPYLPLGFRSEDEFEGLSISWADSFSDDSIAGLRTFHQAVGFGIPTLCFLYMAALLFAPFISTNAVKSYCGRAPGLIPPSHDNPPFYLRLCGPLRDVSERRELERRWSSVIFRHTVARKHQCV